MKTKEKKHKHDIIYATTVEFFSNNASGKYYRVIFNCKKCPYVDIQTVYR